MKKFNFTLLALILLVLVLAYLTLPSLIKTGNTTTTNSDGITDTSLNTSSSKDTTSIAKSDTKDKSEAENTGLNPDQADTESLKQDPQANIYLQAMIKHELSIPDYHEGITPPTAASDDILKLINETSGLDEVIAHLQTYQYNFDNAYIGEDIVSDSYYTLSNKLNHLASDYKPEDLVIPDIASVTNDNVEKRYVRQVLGDALTGLFKAADQEDLHLFTLSGYRSYDTQERIYNNQVSRKGQVEADKVSARPGHSEHQTGLAMDITCQSVDFALVEEFGQTPEGLFVAEHAHEYGLIVRYQKDKTDIVGYSYEPWHLRYVGQALATFLYENDLSLEEFYYAVQSQYKVADQPLSKDDQDPVVYDLNAADSGETSNDKTKANSDN